jgi:hypothetical protein
VQPQRKKLYPGEHIPRSSPSKKKKNELDDGYKEKNGRIRLD